jgi:hypothetical protein
MGVGVLASCEVKFNLTPSKYASPLFALSLLDQQKALRDDIIKLGAEEVAAKPAKKGRAGGGTVKRTFKLTVLVDGATKEFSPGMGIGVLASQEVTFNLPQSKYDSSLFALSLQDQQAALRDDVIKLGVEEVLVAAVPSATEPPAAP